MHQQEAPAIQVKSLSKTYDNGFKALDDITLEIGHGEIFALLGPNGAGKTTLISIITGLVNRSAGDIRVGGHDIVTAYRAARQLLGLVPQELATDSFESVWDTVSFSRGLFGLKRDDAVVESVLRDLSLWDKRTHKIRTLSGGMKRRVMIAKALAHEPRILFLDEPTAGVDVELRRDMWNTVRRLRDSGVTIILTTHYIEEAEEMADRVGVINHGRLLLVEETRQLMKQLGRKRLTIHLSDPLEQLPEGLNGYGLQLDEDGHALILDYERTAGQSRIADLLRKLDANGVTIGDLHTEQSSLEDIFLDLLKDRA
ncbi:ABC-2 type transport system ATP-binding protein [Natronospira proteinivora]|uniref:ABC-2 type transport system ATP-binding protein n=1 Tax=Natronospira proteinivora TaxID=1807133 RepID=A0ABT1G8L0_9GAMM|nr:ABC transporter ATP-binding protein [Natronospira proteinivora]MCP1727661.1 ABC-2 type transport system ATP-binding protein [Natronospira proteinivora]